MPIHFACPNCNKTVEVESRFVGKLADCPYCQQEIQIPTTPTRPPKVEVKVAEEEPPEPVRWGKLPWADSASVDNALRIALLVVGIVIALLLLRIERQLAGVPTLGDRYDESGETPPNGTLESDLRTPLVAPASGIEVSNRVKVAVDNHADDPVPVRIRE